MNAKELHDLYAPLWAAVPETRPKDLFLSAGYKQEPPIWWFLSSQWAADDAQRFGAYENICTDEAAAALCRVEAEDWLGRFVKWNEAWVYDGVPGHWSVHELLEGEDRRMIGAGPTKHHAIVLACHAVHSASPR